MTPAQQKKHDRIMLDVEELLESNVNGYNLLRTTIEQATQPLLMFKMQGIVPSLDVLQNVSKNLLAIVLASQVDKENPLNGVE